MKLEPVPIGKRVNATYLKHPVQRPEIDALKQALGKLLASVQESETEEHNKTLIRDFLKEAHYQGVGAINTKDRADLVIHTTPEATSAVGVIIEVKRPSNTAEMITEEDPNRKALQELVLYYLRERVTLKNLSVKHLIITNIHKWYFFDAADVERTFGKSKALVKSFKAFEAKKLAVQKTSDFYTEIVSPFIDQSDACLPATPVDLRDYAEAASCKPGDPAEKKLIPLCKLLSPQHLLKLAFANDNNSLDDRFYAELLHLLGLNEVKRKAKTLIERKPKEERNAGSLLEGTITQLEARGSTAYLPTPHTYGETEEEITFAVALELTLTWINRLLFLKLLESQLTGYLQGRGDARFLRPGSIQSFDELDALFFQVLNRPLAQRKGAAAKKHAHIPYLNSTLFEPTPLERATLYISNLDQSAQLPALSGTVLRDEGGKRVTGELPIIDYLLRFLDSYNFASERGAEIDEARRTLINPPVLGLIFEKINGYRDGSYFTPGSITMAMCRTAIRSAVVQRFASTDEFSGVSSLDEVSERIDVSSPEDRRLANRIIDSLRVVDPAVGSGHFLVSALNEILAIKSELGVLCYRDGKAVRWFTAHVDNDELTIVDDDSGDVFSYFLNEKGQPPKERQRLQEALFHEKRRIIENCLFGVDINVNSAKICRLRLWIELLKHAYYTAESGYTELETLPNIDINIKVGDSLASQYSIDSNLGPGSEFTAKEVKLLRETVAGYRGAKNPHAKQEHLQLIQVLKTKARSGLATAHPVAQKLHQRESKLGKLANQKEMFALDKKTASARKKTMEKLRSEIKALRAELDALRQRASVQGAFEWRLEFPELLSDDGNFVGFDVVVTNPPYISALEMAREMPDDVRDFYKANYRTAKGAVDIYVLFFERAIQLLRPHGAAALISPNKFLSASYGAALRDLVRAEVRLEQLVDYSDVRVFKEASVYPIVTYFSKAPQEDHPVFRGKHVDGEPPTHLDRVEASLLDLLPKRIWGFLLNDRIELVAKLVHQCVPLSQAGTINATSTAGEADAYHKLIHQGATGYKLINTGTIDPWTCLWGKRELRDKGKLYLEPRLPDDSDEISKNRHELYGAPKIVFAKSALRTEAFYDAKGEYASINTNCMHSFTKDYDPRYILAWLHTRLFQYIFGCYFDAVRMSGGYLPYTAPNLRAMCIKTASEKQQAEVVKIVEKILKAKKTDPTADVSDREQEIDQWFYGAFDLNADEVAKASAVWQ